jgi:hypothetical protein
MSAPSLSEVASPRRAFMTLFWELQMDSVACIIGFLHWVGLFATNVLQAVLPWTIACGHEEIMGSYCCD